MFSVIPDFMQSSILRNPEADNKKENRAIGGGGNLKNSNILGIPNAAVKTWPIPACARFLKIKPTFTGARCKYE